MRVSVSAEQSAWTVDRPRGWHPTKLSKTVRVRVPNMPPKESGQGEVTNGKPPNLMGRPHDGHAPVSSLPTHVALPGKGIFCQFFLFFENGTWRRYADIRALCPLLVALLQEAFGMTAAGSLSSTERFWFALLPSSWVVSANKRTTRSRVGFPSLGNEASRSGCSSLAPRLADLVLSAMSRCLVPTQGQSCSVSTAMGRTDPFLGPGRGFSFHKQAAVRPVRTL